MIPRTGELTGHLSRELFDQMPDDNDERELTRWVAFRDAYHRAHQLDGAPSPFPLQLDFELNSTCQLRCTFCVHGQERVPKKMLDRELFEKAIDEGVSHGLCSIKLNYINEPLLRRDLEDFIRYARERGVLNVYFATNGLLLTRDRARSLIDAGVTKIMVSLDAARADTYRVMRRSTKFDEVVENILGFIEERNSRGRRFPLVRVNFLRTKLNSEEAGEFVAQWQDVADLIGFQQQVQMPGVDDDLLGMRDSEGPFRCSFPWKLLVIDSNGDILPCCTFSGREMPIGNVRELSIQAAWQSITHRRLQVLHQDGDGTSVSVCAHCIGDCAKG